MAEQQPSAAARSHPRIRRSATHTGVTHIRRHQPDRYTIIGNHLAQHRELSLTAIGVGTHILSLPEGAAVDIRSLAARFPEGRDRIAFALRELEAQGYVKRVRERTSDGRVITRTYAHNAPGPARTAPDATSPGATAPGATAPDATVRERREEAPQAPRPPVPQVSPPVAEAPRGERHDTARALLVGLRRTDDRLTLAERDVRRLVPALATWLDNGASPAAVHRTLAADLPRDLKRPAELLAYRLRELLPPPLPSGPGIPPGGDPHARKPSPPHPLQTCDGCDRAFRAREPGLCRDCRSGPTDGDCWSGPTGAGIAVAA